MCVLWVLCGFGGVICFGEGVCAIGVVVGLRVACCGLFCVGVVAVCVLGCVCICGLLFGFVCGVCGVVACWCCVMVVAYCGNSMRVDRLCYGLLEVL